MTMNALIPILKKSICQLFPICRLTHTLRTNSIENRNVIKTPVCFTIVLNETSCVLCDLINLDFCITRYIILIYTVCAYIIRLCTYVIKCVKYLNTKRFTYNYNCGCIIFHIAHHPNKHGPQSEFQVLVCYTRIDRSD